MGLKSGFLSGILILSLLAIVVLPIYTISYTSPSFTKLFLAGSEREAVQSAQHLASMLIGDGTELNADSLPSDLSLRANKLREDFSILKLKIFSSSGVVLFSTIPEETGKINRERYFHEHISRGNVYTKFIQEGDRSLEGQREPADVVETYVPIMRNGRFIGAFEIYYDISAEKTELDRLISRSSAIVFILTFVLLIAVAISSFRARKSIAERERMEERLRAISVTDDLTGLLNRRGFFNLAQQQLKTANRINREMVLLFADLDDLKKINDTMGHHEGDCALIETAHLLKKTFRDADILARLGGDEFAAFMIGGSEHDDRVILDRLRESLEKVNKQPDRLFKLSLSVGIVRYSPENPCSVDELLAQADALMYKQKQGKP